MAKYKYKFLVTTVRPKGFSAFRDTVAQVEVTGSDKYEIGKKWGAQEVEYPVEHYSTCLTETNNKLREYQDDPKDKVIDPTTLELLKKCFEDSREEVWEGRFSKKCVPKYTFAEWLELNSKIIVATIGIKSLNCTEIK